MHAHDCPSCGARLMSFAEFFRRVDPGTITTCRNCGAQLRRSGAVWALLTVAGVLFAALALLLIQAEWSPIRIIVAMLIALPVWIVAVKYIGWAAVPWKPASAQGSKQQAIS